MKLFNDLHYLPMPHIIFPPGFILPPPPGIRLMIYTIYPLPISSPPPVFILPPPPPPIFFCPLEII